MLARILLIEHDPELAQRLEALLLQANCQVSAISDGTLGFLAARKSSPDIVIVGSVTTGIPPLEICRRLRLTHDTIAIMVLTETRQPGDRIAALRAGADDCLSKPFHSDELLARLQVQLRHLKQHTSPYLRFGDLVLDPQARQVYRGSATIELTTKEFDFLNYFMTHPRQVLTRDQIIENVWGYEFLGTSNIVEVYIRYLRRKLENHNAERLIHTVRGIGYVLREAI
jgi:DNA-binding response OmpR family regulator